MYAENKYDNPYTDVTVWADLKGPGFEKRVFGFWNGGNVFCIRVTATSPGIWSYTTGASVSDPGLTGVNGAYLALEWTEAEKDDNPCRRGIIHATANGHAMEYADGTPYVMIGDTWWGLSSYRYPWVEDDIERPIGPDMTMKDMARHRLRQGYNTVGIIAAFPTWAKNDGYPAVVKIDDEHETYVRGAWGCCSVSEWLNDMVGESHVPARDMHNEGGRPFLFPGKIKGYENICPDYDRINPEFFKILDKKINWLNANGITVFIEALRRDSSRTWKYYYDWPMCYTRYIQYLFARYQANNILFSPIHFDGNIQTIDSKEFNEPINLFIDLYGQPPFGTLLGTNPPGSSKTAYGGPEEQHWKTFDQIGNWRDHQYHWLLTDIFHDLNPLPAINGEPYYSGHISFLKNGSEATLLIGNVESAEDHMNCRSSIYGSVLSGAYAGVLAGFEAGWSGNVEPEELPYKLWDTMTFPASNQVRYVRDFLLSEGKAYQNLIPDAELVCPNFRGDVAGWRGWIACSATRDRDLVMGYSEKDAPSVNVRGLRPYDFYELTWFNPRNGKWTKYNKPIQVNDMGIAVCPPYPDDFDWAFKLKKLHDDFPIENALSALNQNSNLDVQASVKIVTIETDSIK